MTVRITQKEMSELVKQFGITDAKAKMVFENFMNSKLDECKADARAEAFKEMKKQAEVDKKHLVESLQTITEKTIAEQQKKIDYHKSELLKQKLALNEAQNAVSKKVTDSEQAIREEYEAKYASLKSKCDSTIKTIKESALKLVSNEKAKMARKIEKFVNESVHSLAKQYSDKTHELNSAISELQNFVTEQVKSHVVEHRAEMKSLEEAKVSFMKETAAKFEADKKKFIKESASKVNKFIVESIEDKYRELHSDIRRSQKNEWGYKIYETVKNEFAKQFFNDNKYANALAKASSKKLRQAKQIVETANKKIEELNRQNKALMESKDAAVREQIILESSNGLPETKKSMLRSLVKDIPTEKLKSKIDSYIPMIMKENFGNQINRVNGKMLTESKNRVVTGDSKPFKPVVKAPVRDEIAEAIEEFSKL